MRETWVIAILLALLSPASHRSQNGSPNLKPFQPDGWADAIVVSNRQGDYFDTRELNPFDLLYIDFAVINSGSSPAAAPFRIELFVDGRLRESFDVSPPLDPQVYRFREDYPIGRLDIGTHTIRVVADAGKAVSESDESDNEYTKTIIVGGDCIPLVHRVSPRGAGVLTPSREPNCSGFTVSSLAVHGDYPGKELGIGGEPIVKARRARAFAALRAKARLEDRVRAIVGLRTGGPSAATAAIASSEADLQSTRIAQAQQSLMNRMNAHNVSPIRRFKFIPYLAMDLDEAALEALSSDPEVVSIEEDLVVKPLLEESTLRVGAPEAWSQGFSGSGQTVAILDTGVDKHHPFLAGKVVSEACYSGSLWYARSLCPEGVRESTEPGSGMPCPSTFSDCFHGTAVAGVAAGHGTDFSGVARDARIIAIQMFSGCGGDCLASSNSDWIAGLERVQELSADHSIAAVTRSFGGLVEDDKDCDADFPAAKAAMDNLRAVGIAPVAASGNSGSGTSIDFPACLSSAVSVGSTNFSVDGANREEVSYFSNSSSLLDLLAPGRWITTAVPAGGFGRFSGTSLAAPHVTGAWAVLKSKAPDAALPQLLFMLSRTGIPIADPRNDLVRPRIQVDAALNVVIPPLSYSSGTLLTLTATPNPGFRFRLWRGCDSSSGNRCVVEMDSVKNVSAIFEPLGAAPDLLVTSLMTPPTATLSSAVSIASEIHNQGATDAGPFRVGFYLSEDPTITPEDTWIAACYYDKGLPAGESETCSRSYPVPLWVSPGPYFLGAIVDDLDRVAENRETNNARAADSGPVEVLAPRASFRSFIPVILSAAGLNDSFFTSELTLTNRGNQEAQLDYTYTAHIGGGSGAASGTLAPGQQKIVTDTFRYLRNLGLPIPESGNRIGTLAVESLASTELGIMVRTTTAVREGRAGLAYPGVPGDGGFHEPVFLCGLRQNEQDRSNLAFQHVGTAEDGPIGLATRVYSGDPADREPRIVEDVMLEPGEFHQFSGVLGSVPNGYVEVRRFYGNAPFYAYGVINDQANSDGSFIFPVPSHAGTGRMGQTLPVIVETGNFSSELTATNFSVAGKTLRFAFVADAVRTPDRTATLTLALEAGEQQIIPRVIDFMRQKGIAGIPAARGGLAGSLFVTEENGDMSGIVVGARTGSPDGRGGRYGVFYNAVPDGSAFIDNAWVDGLQQNEENRSNLALVNTGEVDGGDSVFSLDIYDGDTGRLVRTITRTVPARRWRQINAILADHAQGTRQGYVHIRKISGNNPFLAYGVVNDGGTPGQRSGDGTYLPARE